VPRRRPPATGTVHQFVAGKAKIGSIGRFNAPQHQWSARPKKPKTLWKTWSLLPNRCKTMSWFGAASGQSTTRSACLLSVLKISSGAGARLHSFATSADRGIVEREFTEPATSPALLRVRARRGRAEVVHPQSAGAARARAAAPPQTTWSRRYRRSVLDDRQPCDGTLRPRGNDVTGGGHRVGS